MLQLSVLLFSTQGGAAPPVRCRGFSMVFSTASGVGKLWKKGPRLPKKQHQKKQRKSPVRSNGVSSFFHSFSMPLWERLLETPGCHAPPKKARIKALPLLIRKGVLFHAPGLRSLRCAYLKSGPTHSFFSSSKYLPSVRHCLGWSRFRTDFECRLDLRLPARPAFFPSQTAKMTASTSKSIFMQMTSFCSFGKAKNV